MATYTIDTHATIRRLDSRQAEVGCRHSRSDRGPPSPTWAEIAGLKVELAGLKADLKIIKYFFGPAIIILRSRSLLLKLVKPNTSTSCVSRRPL